MRPDYYDDLAPYYHYIYGDWESSLKRQALALDGIIKDVFEPQIQTILDAACGIGTQSIGLAELGYQVTASDFSAAALLRARKEAKRRGLQIDFQEADMRQLGNEHQEPFDLVIACDNAVPHLPDDQEISRAFQAFFRCTRPGGGCLITVRDYSRLERRANRPKLLPRHVHQTAEGRVVLTDVWDFADHDHYQATTYLIDDRGRDDVQVKAIRGGSYYCVELPTLILLLREAGFDQVHEIHDRYFQPVLAAVR